MSCVFSQRVNTAIMDEFVRRVFEALCTDEELESLQPKIGELAVVGCVIAEIELHRVWQ